MAESGGSEVSPYILNLEQVKKQVDSQSHFRALYG